MTLVSAGGGGDRSWQKLSCVDPVWWLRAGDECVSWRHLREISDSKYSGVGAGGAAQTADSLIVYLHSPRGSPSTDFRGARVRHGDDLRTKIQQDPDWEVVCNVAPSLARFFGALHHAFVFCCSASVLINGLR